MSITLLVVAKLTMFFAPLFGSISLLFFVAFLYNGPFDLFTHDLSLTTTLGINSFLSCFFFFQHSFMVRKFIQTRLEKIIPVYSYNAFYALVSSITLCLVILFWQTYPALVYDIDGMIALILRVLFFSALLGTIWGAFALKNFDPFGRTQIQSHFLGRPQKPQSFKIRGPYLYVRHPLYFFTLVLIWSTPVMTIDRALFNLLWTIWIFVGTLLEERDLLISFGDRYRQYQKQTPMLIPWKIPQSKEREMDTDVL